MEKQKNLGAQGIKDDPFREVDIMLKLIGHPHENIVPLIDHFVLGDFYNVVTGTRSSPLYCHTLYPIPILPLPIAQSTARTVTVLTGSGHCSPLLR